MFGAATELSFSDLSCSDVTRPPTSPDKKDPHWPKKAQK